MHIIVYSKVTASKNLNYKEKIQLIYNVNQLKGLIRVRYELPQKEALE